MTACSLSHSLQNCLLTFIEIKFASRSLVQWKYTYTHIFIQATPLQFYKCTTTKTVWHTHFCCAVDSGYATCVIQHSIAIEKLRINTLDEVPLKMRRRKENAKIYTKLDHLKFPVFSQFHRKFIYHKYSLSLSFRKSKSLNIIKWLKFITNNNQLKLICL